MKKSIVFMFSGQGSQYYQMGRVFLKNSPIFRKITHSLDEFAYNLIGESVMNYVFNDRKRASQSFDRTLYTHPAIFIVEYAMAQMLLELGIKPDYVLGTSLGEFTAAAVAEIMSAEELLELVIIQAQLLEDKCENGGMLAVLHNPDIFNRDAFINQNSELAAINFNSHFVISGEKSRIIQIHQHLTGKGIICENLPVQIGFHSASVESIQSKYLQLLYEKIFMKPQIRYISSLYGSELSSMSYEYLWEVVRKPIQFKKAIEELESNKECIYLDLGPSGTLATFIKYLLNNRSPSVTFDILSPFKDELNNLQKIKDYLA